MNIEHMLPAVLKHLAKKLETASTVKRYHHVSSDSEEEEIKPSKRSALSVQLSHEELKQALLKYGMHLRQLAEGKVHCNYQDHTMYWRHKLYIKSNKSRDEK